MNTRALVAILACVLAGVGCEAIIGADFGVKDGQCSHAQVPERPTTDAVDDKSLLLVADSIDFGEDKPAFDQGFDLDGLCTGQGQGPLCNTPNWIDAGALFDGPGGRDNGIGPMVAAQYDVFKARPFASIEVSTQIRAGKLAPLALFRITRWNGSMDDANVRVDWFTPVRSQSDAGLMMEIDVSEKSVAPNGMDAVAYDSSAYVRGGVLVAKFGLGPNLPYLRLIDASLQILGATITIPIAKGEPYAGSVISGWTPGQALLESLPIFTAFANTIPTCKDAPYYKGIKEYVCRFADFTLDGKRSDRNCNAMSLGIGVTLRSAMMGKKVADARAQLCPAATDTLGENCDAPP